MQLVVMKFGGTSVQDATALRRLIDIVAAEKRQKLLVVSALAGVTDTLSDLCGSGRPAIQVTDALCQRHVEIVRTLVATDAQRALIERVQLRFAAAARLAHTGAHVSARERDTLLAIGELASSEVVAAVLATAGVSAAWVDARHVIVTDSSFGQAKPDPASTREASGCELRPLLAAGKVPIVGGFVGATVAGLTTTLGRGGSDYSASLLAAALDACEIQIWTDVDGVLSADPRVVADPVPVPALTFREAYELARFGAKVLHWGTLEPASLHDIPVRVLNAKRTHARGTTITASRPGSGNAVTGLAHQSCVHVAELTPAAVTGCFRFVRQATEWLDREGRCLTIVSLSPSRLVVTASDGSVIRELAAALAPAARARVQNDCDLVTVVGKGVAASPGAWAVIAGEQAEGRLFEAIPVQSGDALACPAPRGAGPGVIRDLHTALVHGARTVFPAYPNLPPIPTSPRARLGTQSIAGA